MVFMLAETWFQKTFANFNFLLHSKNNGKWSGHTEAVLTDLSKAFDYIYHELL